jgi:1,4-dihydroxy-2-naphthoyl-CoA hydrolase
MSTPAFEHRFRVALHDTDAAGVLFFARLFRHAHDAYEAWMAQLGFPLDALLRDGGLRLPIVHAEADYRRPMHHGDRVLARLTVGAVGDASYSIDYSFIRADGTVAATARTVHVGLDAGGERTLPPKLHAALQPAARASKDDTGNSAQ